MSLREHFILEINMNVLSIYISQFIMGNEFKIKKAYTERSFPMQAKASQLFLLLLTEILE